MPEKLTQDEQRERRRQRLTVHLDGRFDLTAEVAAIVHPVAYQVSRPARPEVMLRDVDAVGDAVAEVVHVAAGLIAESKAADDRTRRLAADLAVRPRQPVITDEQIISGSWSGAMVAYAEQVAGDLAALLDRALPPDAEGLRGNPSASARVVAALRILDRAARDLDRRIPSVRQRQGLPSMDEFNRQLREQQDRDRATAALARFGVAT